LFRLFPLPGAVHGPKYVLPARMETGVCALERAIPLERAILNAAFRRNMSGGLPSGPRGPQPGSSRAFAEGEAAQSGMCPLHFRNPHEERT
jgi:hypothetical protein